MKAKAFDTLVFKRILKYTKPYQWRFNSVVAFAISLSVFAALRPYLLKQTVDGYIKTHNAQGLLFYIALMGIVLLLEVFSQFYFVLWANWLGQDIVKDIRVKLFRHMLRFRMKYYDNAPVGHLVTRSVSDIEQIAKIFSQGLFMIISDLLKMVGRADFYVLHELETDVDCYYRDATAIIFYTNFPTQNESRF